MSVTPYIPSLIIDQVIDALGAFITPFIGGAEIYRAQVNRVAAPPVPSVELTEILTVDLETPSLTTDEDNQVITILGPKRIDIQIDFRGEGAGDQCNAVKTVYRTPYATSMFPANIQPLYCTDGHQMQMVTAEQQYESRWTLTASLQYNPTVSVPTQFAKTLAVTSLEDIQ